MSWMDAVWPFFTFRTNVAVVVIALYLVPILKFVLYPVCINAPKLVRLNRITGQYEHAVAWFRDTLGAAYLVLAGVSNVCFGLEWRVQSDVNIGVMSLVFVGLSFVNYLWKKKARKNLLVFIKPYPAICPKEFFDYLLCASGCLRQRLPEKPIRTVDPAHLDFRTPTRCRLPYYFENTVAGLWSTVWCTKMALCALKWGGDVFFNEVISSIAVIWGTRMVELSRAELVVEEMEKLDDIHGLNIYLPNHASFLDFALMPVLLGAKMNREKSLGRQLLPKFMIAKDHFKDNPIFYRILGLGRVAEKAGMIFVTRHENKKEAMSVIKETASRMVKEGSDVAIFPQGTRALKRFDLKGDRIEAGYYTIGKLKRLRRDGAHIKKGAAYLGTDMAIELSKQGIKSNVNLIPVAIKGTAVVAPKGSPVIKPFVTIRLKIGEPVVLKPSEVSRLEIGSESYLKFIIGLNKKIDCALKTAVGVHWELERRFFEDMRKTMDPSGIEEMSLAMKMWRGEDYIVFAILDCIYTCKPRHWNPLIGRLVYLIRNNAAREELLAFKGEVAEKMLS